MEISVVMSVFNEERKVLRAVNSILNQTYTDFEFIIVNDGSTDATLEKLLQIQDPRVKIFNLKENSGVSLARNFGVNQAKGKWIAVQDADDFSMPTRLEEQIEYLRSRHDLGAVASFIQCTATQNVGLAAKIESEYNSIYSYEQIEYFKHYALLICHGSAIFNKELFERVGGYNPKYIIAHDYELWLKILDVAKIEKINKVLYQWQISNNSLHRKNERDTCNEVMAISLRKISKDLRIRKNKLPTVTFLGPKNACENLQTTILKNTNLFKSTFIYEGLNHYKPEKARMDAIIVLEGPNSWEMVEKLKWQGFKINQNLFHIWNIIH